MAFTYQGEAFGRRVKPLAEEVAAKLVLPCDVEDSASVAAVFETLKAVDAVGDDFRWDPGGGGCGKAGQSGLPVGNGAPHVRLARCVIGGV